jgi:hypothetical protein
MSIFNFIFLLGANFVIFGFIWGVFKYLITSIIGNKEKNQQLEYILRITKYILLVAVTANFVHSKIVEQELIQSFTARVIISSMILGLYLLGKLENKDRFSQFTAMGGNLLQGITSNSSFNHKTERLLIFGSLTFFMLCLFLPAMVNNGLINWLSSAILNLYNAFFIGFIFKIIAFFSIITIMIRGSNILGKLVSGKSLTESFTKEKKTRPFGNMRGNNFGGGTQNQQNNSTVEDDYNKKASTNTDSEGFTEYEDVTEK